MKNANTSLKIENFGYSKFPPYSGPETAVRDALFFNTFSGDPLVQDIDVDRYHLCAESHFYGVQHDAGAQTFNGVVITHWGSALVHNMAERAARFH